VCVWGMATGQEGHCVWNQRGWKAREGGVEEWEEEGGRGRREGVRRGWGWVREEGSHEAQARGDAQRGVDSMRAAG